MTVETISAPVKVEARFVGFGARDEFGAHLFKVVVPSSSNADVTVLEDYGFKGGENGLPASEVRVVLPRRFWTAISETLRKNFAARLKEKNLSSSRWTVGENKVDRILGKELCVLAWAVEHAKSVDEAKAIAARWVAFRPEERWWLFSQTAAECGTADEKDQGWRMALYFALAGGKAPHKDSKKTKRPVDPEDTLMMGLFPNELL